MEYSNDSISLSDIIKHMEEALSIINPQKPMCVKGSNTYVDKIIRTSIMRKPIKKILTHLGYKVELISKEKYSVSPDEKFWSIDFLTYTLHFNAHLPLTIFYDDLSRVEIKKFVRDEVYCALLDEIPRSIIFDEVDLRY